MKNVYDVNWKRVCEKFGIGLGSQGKAFTTDVSSLSSVMFVRRILVGRPKRQRRDVDLRATSEDTEKEKKKFLTSIRYYATTS